MKIYARKNIHEYSYQRTSNSIKMHKDGDCEDRTKYQGLEF
jgi:hypothetical protein